MSYRRQRIRDPLHGLIEFRDEQFEDMLWRSIQTRPFQRLRRVKQLGFSELVYPGATHTRFAHCLGTFRVGRQLMEIVEQQKGRGIKEPKVQQVLAATLLHDVGHGPFSHAFEDVGKRLMLKWSDHEQWSDRLIRDTEIGDILKEMGSGFANDVADIIKRGHPGDMYEAVVSSQFDADRLDYMQRDRLMTGTQHGAIDFAWLLANIEVGEVTYGVDDDEDFHGAVETFVLGPKAVSAAETYVLGLFQLYQTVYLHKATRGIEKLFTKLLIKLFETIRSNDVIRTGLPSNHPLTQFALDPENIENYLLLDDAVVWGALPMVAQAADPIIAELARRLRERKLYKCLDIRQLVEEQLAPAKGIAPPYCQDPARPCPNWTPDEDKAKLVQTSCAEVFARLSAWEEEHPLESHHLLLDRVSREPYKRLDYTKGPLNQIRIRSSVGGELVDIGSRSEVVRAIPTIAIWRAYMPSDQHLLRDLVQNVVREVVNEQRS